mgnify:CR=1 FL=1
MTSPDITHMLAELAAIQRDVRTIAETLHFNHALRTAELAESTCSRLGHLMASITAPPPALLPVDPAAEAMVSQLMAANTPPATTSRKLEAAEAASIDDGGRCHHCGHFEISYTKASERYAHCPSCNRHTRWIRVPAPADVSARLAMVSKLEIADNGMRRPGRRRPGGAEMTKRAEWNRIGNRWFLRVAAMEVLVEQLRDDLPWQWRLTSPRDRTPPPRLFPTLAAAQADAVQWLRATIAEMAAMLPEVE